MRLKVLSLALSMGIVLGIGCFLMTLIINTQGGGGHLIMMHRVWPGYCISAGGSFLALIYGFVYGFIFGGVVAWLYNSIGGRKA